MNTKIKHILRCHASGMGVKPISSALMLSRNTVKRYLRQIDSSGIELERLLQMDEAHLREMFGHLSGRTKGKPSEYDYLESKLPEYLKRLKERGVTRQQLYEEYLRGRPRGYSYDSFCRYIRQMKEVKIPVGRIEHIAGDQMYIDFAGDKLSVTDKETGLITPVEVFAAILPCSQLIYYEAVPSQKKEHLIQATENALHYYEGAPNAIVPDNLKSAVIKASRIEPVINEEFAAFAEHYGCVVFPARVRKPKDKALVEYAVRLLYREVYAKMHGKIYTTIEALNADIWRYMEQLNNKKMSSRNYSRRERFEEVERMSLRPLPEQRYMLKRKKIATVIRTSYVSLFRHYYSVPREYIGQAMELVYDCETVEIYFKHRLVTVHKRDDTPFEYSQKKSHNLPTRPTDYTQKMEEIYALAQEISPQVRIYVQAVAMEKKYPESAYRSCKGIVVRLSEKYGKERIADACQLALEMNLYSYNDLKTLLSSGEDKKYRAWLDGESTGNTPDHKNVRGKGYFKKQLKEKNNGK